MHISRTYDAESFGTFAKFGHIITKEENDIFAAERNVILMIGETAEKLGHEFQCISYIMY